MISVAAELAGVHPQTLRIYERKGLVDPARTPGGSRRYSDDDIALLRRIQELTNEGLNLAGVQRVLELEAENRRPPRPSWTHARGSDVARSTPSNPPQYRRDLVPVQQASSCTRAAAGARRPMPRRRLADADGSSAQTRRRGGTRSSVSSLVDLDGELDEPRACARLAESAARPARAMVDATGRRPAGS